MKPTQLVLTILVASIFFLNSCYKHKDGGIRNPNVLLTERGFLAQKMIPERNAIWGVLYDSALGAKKVEFNLETKLFKNMKYSIPLASYYVHNESAIYASILSSGLNDVQILNLIDSTVLKTVHFDYFVNSCAVADSKLYILEGTIGPSKLHVYDLFNLYAYDSLWVGTNAVNIAVSKDGSRIYTSTETLSNTAYSSEYKKSDSTLSDIAVAKPIGEFSFKEGSYSMSDNGKKILTNESILYGEALLKLHDYYLPSLPFKLANDGSSAVFIEQKFALEYDANGYNQRKQVLLPNFGGDNYSFSSILPYYYRGNLYAAINYSDTKYYFKSIIAKL